MKHSFEDLTTIILVLCLFISCEMQETNGGIDGESHFLKSCQTSCEEGLSCICGVCTTICKNNKSCEELSPASTCVNPDIAGVCMSSEGDASKTCDVACISDKDCKTLGENYQCDGDFCRIPDESKKPQNDGGDAEDASDNGRITEGGNSGEDADVADSRIGETESTITSCQTAAAQFTERVIELASQYSTCSTDQECILLAPSLICPDYDIRMHECPHTVSSDQADKFLSDVEELDSVICVPSAMGCVASGSCPEVEVSCEAGECIGRPIEP